MPQYPRMRLRFVPPFLNFEVCTVVEVPLDRDFDGRPSKAAAMVVSGVEDEMHRDEVHVFKGSFMQGAGFVVAALESIHMGRYEGIAGHVSLVQTYLVQLQAVERCIGVLWHDIDWGLARFCLVALGLAWTVTVVLVGLLPFSTRPLKPRAHRSCRTMVVH